MRGSHRATIMAAMIIAMLDARHPVPEPQVRTGKRKQVRTYRPRLNTAQDRDIAAHNVEVERRKAEKLARKIDRKLSL
jgi:hypothetical protein